MSKQCEQCSEPFIPREAKQRFCCKACSVEWFNEEKRQALARFRAQRSNINCDEATQ